MAEENINVRIVSNEIQVTINTNNPVVDLFLNLIINEVLSSIYDDDYEEDDDENDAGLNYALRESEQMYKFLEKKNVKLDIKSQLYKDINNNSDCTECVICKDNFKSKDITVNLSCNHIFHNECINEWSLYNPICPICRTNINIK